MIWEIAIENITSWYYIMIAVILGVGLYGTWKHDTGMPIVWAGMVSVILYYGALTIEPLIFGYEYYPMYSIQWFLVSAFGLMFMLIFGTYCWNIINYGNVVE